MPLTCAPDAYDDRTVNGSRPAATAAAGAAALPGYVNGGTPHNQRRPWGSASIFIVPRRRSATCVRSFGSEEGCVRRILN